METARHVVRAAWLVLIVLCLQHGGSLRVLAQSAEGYALVEAVNAYRESVGLPRLATSGALMVAAQRHAEWMAATYTYSHTGEGGSSPNDRAAAAGFNGTVGENVGGSTEATPAEMIFFWDQSSGHRVTMRQALATHIGGGFAVNTQQRLFVLLIGTAPGQSPLPTTQPIAGGTPAIAYTPPPGMVWSADGVLHQQSDYVPAAPSSEQQPVEQSAPAAEVAYVMPFDLIRQAEPGPDGSIVHIVEAGQTAWAIAARYGVNLEDVLAINRLPASPVLYPGDQLIIRLGEGQQPPTAPAAPSTHPVRAGESLWTIAARYGVSVDDLRAWNNLAAGALIQPGEVLAVAPPAPIPTAPLPPAPTLTISPFPTVTATQTPTLTALPPTVTPSPAGIEVAAQVTLPPLTEIAAPAEPPRDNSLMWLVLLLGALAVMLMLFAGAAALWLALKKGLRSSL
jgi:LysM repeat protein